jgi:hypothetical protein
MALVTDSMGGGHPEFDRNQRIYAPRTLTADGPFLYDKRNKHGKNHTHIIPYLDLSMFIYMILFIFSNHPKKNKFNITLTMGFVSKLATRKVVFHCTPASDQSWFV